LLGRHGQLDPRGVRLRGARIDGTLDLDDVQATTPLRLTDCHAPVIWLERAHLHYLALVGVTTTSVVADGLRVDHDLALTRLRATGTGSVIRLRGARIGGALDFEGAELASTDGPALHADGLQVAGGMFLRGGFRASGAGDRGVIRLLGVHIRSNLDCDRT